MFGRVPCFVKRVSSRFAARSLLPTFLVWALLLTVLGPTAGCSDTESNLPGEEAGGTGNAGAGGSAGTAGVGGTAGTAGGAGTMGGWGGTGGYPNMWVSVYYPGWTADRLPIDKLDFSSLTHLIHFSLVPTDTGGVDDTTNSVGASAASTVIAAAHAAGKKVLIAIGGANTGSAFAKAISDANRATFVNNLVTTAKERGYDGIDVDMEPINNKILFQTFSRDLRAAINAQAPGMLLTTAALGASSGAFGPLSDVYDQINIMSYDLVYGPNTTWHNSAISGGSGQYYSADRSANEFKSAGVAPAKLGIGIECSGYSYTGATEPKQPKTSDPQSVTYVEIVQTLFMQDAYVWDPVAHAPYLSIKTGSTQFVTYDDPRLASEKVHFVGKNAYGGLIVWDPSLAYFPAEAAGKQHPLLQAVKEAAFGP